jgi:hypothetical protein
MREWWQRNVTPQAFDHGQRQPTLSALSLKFFACNATGDMSRTNVKKLYELVRMNVLNPSDASEETFLLITDLEFLEASIAGVAAKIIEGIPITSEDMRILNHQSLEGTSYMGRLGKFEHDGEARDCFYDLSTRLDILEHASNIEELRRACLNAAANLE